MKKCILLLGIFLSLDSCNSDGDSEDIPITTETAITKNILNLFAGGPLGRSTNSLLQSGKRACRWLFPKQAQKTGTSLSRGLISD